jgi:hypothetical protein
VITGKLDPITYPTHLEHDEVEWWKRLYELSLGEWGSADNGVARPEQIADRGVEDLRSRTRTTNGLTIQEMDAL